MAKKAMAKAQDHEPFVAGEDVLKFSPQWLSKTAPKYLDKAGMSHAVWVASWWSRSLTQIASQGHSEVSTMAFQDLLNEFLNINQIAVEKSESLAWNYDKHVWNEIQQKVERKDKTLDIKDTLGAVVQNDLDVVSQKLQSGGKGMKTFDRYHQPGGQSKGGWSQSKGSGKAHDGHSNQWLAFPPSSGADKSKGSKKGKHGKDKSKGKK